MSAQDIRWQQRLQSFGDALVLLQTAMSIQQPNVTEKAGLIQFFEISFELSWKLLKDYLEAQGFEELRSPRDSIKKAFEVDIIENGHVWLDALKNRNLTSHIYSEQMADKVVARIRTQYAPLLEKLHHRLQQEV